MRRLLEEQCRRGKQALVESLDLEKVPVVLAFANDIILIGEERKATTNIIERLLIPLKEVGFNLNLEIKLSKHVHHRGAVKRANNFR